MMGKKKMIDDRSNDAAATARDGRSIFDREL
jgi:hypothetical protein